MRWETENYKGDRQVWYSEDVIEKIKTILNNFHKNFYGSCCDCEYNDCEDDCAKYHIELIEQIIQEVE